MTSPRTGLRVASILFGVFAIVHLVRIFNNAPVTVGTHVIPLGVSWVALVIAGLLCIWFWRLGSAAR